MPTQWIVKRAPDSRSDHDRRASTDEMPFIVIADNDNENHLNARRATSSALSIPVFGELHPHDPAMFCVGAEAKPRRNSLNVFDVTARYTSERGTSEDEQTETNPLLWTTKKRLTFQDVVEPYAYDTAGRPCVDSAGIPFNPLPVRDVSRPILEIEKNVLATNVGELMYYTNKVNSDEWFGWLPGEVRLKIIGGAEQTYTDTDTGITIRFVNVTYQLQFKETQSIPDISANPGNPLIVEGWDDAILDQGLYERSLEELFRIKTGSDRTIEYGGATGPDGDPVVEPMLLDGTGRLLYNPGQEIGDVDVTPQYIIRRPYQRIAFGPLNLL